MTKQIVNRLWFDGGSSGLKVLASVDGFLQGFLVPPGARELTRFDESDRHNEKGRNYPPGVGVVECGGSIWRVGEMPEVCFTAEMKASTAVPKILSALGAIAGSREMDFELVVLLPCDEYLSRVDLAKRIRSAVDGAIVNGKPLNVEIQSIRFHPEGSGLAAHLPGILLAVMVGHTDISLVRYEHGRVNVGKSRTFGRSGVGAIAVNMGVPGGDGYIAEALATKNLTPLTAGGLSSGTIKKEFQQKRFQHLQENVAPQLRSYSCLGIDGYVLGGGGSPQLRSALAQCLPLDELESSLPEGLHLFSDELDELRFADVFGVAYRYLKDEIDEKLRAERMSSRVSKALGVDYA